MWEVPWQQTEAAATHTGGSSEAEELHLPPVQNGFYQIRKAEGNLF